MHIRLSHFLAALLLRITVLSAMGQMTGDMADVAKMTPAEAERFLQQPNSGRVELKFIESIFQAQRLDLISVAWRISYKGFVQDQAAKLPDTAFKEEVLLLMLRTDSMAWPDTIKYGSRGIFENTDPYTPLIRKYLPNVEPTVSLINSREARSRLVAQIEEARKLGKTTQSEQPDNSQPETLALPPKLSAAEQSAAPRPEPDPAAIEGQPAPVPEGRQTAVWPLVVGIFALVVVVVFALKRRT